MNAMNMHAPRQAGAGNHDSQPTVHTSHLRSPASGARPVPPTLTPTGEPMETVTIRSMIQPAEVAGGLAVAIHALDQARAFVTDREVLATVDRAIICSAAMLNGAPYLHDRYVSPRVAEIMDGVADANRQPRRARA